MRTCDQLEKDFALYVEEIDRCEAAHCYWALMHILLALPDVCASLETDPKGPPTAVGDRYVAWCNAHLPGPQRVSAADRFQMRNALLHAGSTTAENRGKKHGTSYMHFSYIDPDTYDPSVHETTDSTGRILNVHVKAMATETKQALLNWFNALQTDPVKMSYVEQNISRLCRLQPKSIVVERPDGRFATYDGWTRSST